MGPHMKIRHILALALLAGASSTGWATYNNHGCGGGHNQCSGNNCPPPPPPPPECVVEWDFTDNTTAQTGDPLTYTGTSTEGGNYSLVVNGFGIGRGDRTYTGNIYDGTSTYAVDPDTSNRYGIGVHQAGESTHWGTKIDNQKTDSENKYIRDAVLLDFGSCIVSIEEISLLTAYSGADTDFELWAYTGGTELVGVDNSVIPQIPDYDTWTGNADWVQVLSSNGGTSDRVVSVNSSIASRYYVMIAGYDKMNNNDAFRLAGITVSCDPVNCPPDNGGGGGSGGGVPVPGTLALLGIGALAARRRLVKAR